MTVENVLDTPLFALVLEDEMELHGWEFVADEFWFRCTPPSFPFRTQGWKIHLSTAFSTAQELLDAVLPVLLDEAVAFKFAKSTNQLKALLSHRFDRGSGSKFITIYPRDDEHFSRLLGLLDVATAEFHGPAIFSDRRLKKESVVHYRYGAISGQINRLCDEGFFDIPIIGPTGEFFEDQRNPWYSPPEWAELPEIPSTNNSIIIEESDGDENLEFLLNDKYKVIEAIRHSNRGGVYRGQDISTGKYIIIKEARPFIGPEDDGTDVTDRLRHEFEILKRFSSEVDFLPKPVDLFEEGGHSFLIETELSGVTVREWWQSQTDLSSDELALHEATKKSMIQDLENLVVQVHAAGFFLRDLTPGNLMLCEDQLLLIDPEYFAPKGLPAAPAFTYGYASLASIRQTTLSIPTDDDFSLGMCIAFICSGIEPPIIVPETSDDDAHLIISDWVALVTQRSSLAREMESRIRSLLNVVPTSPLNIGKTQTELVDNTQKALADGLDFLTDVDWKAVKSGQISPWRADDSGSTFGDPASVQTGFAGIIQFLSDVASTPLNSERTEACLRNAAYWIVDVLERRGDRTLPGLFFGRSGCAWALQSASVALKDEAINAAARNLLLSTPINWKNPDMTHGLAGLGTAHLNSLRNHPDMLIERRARIIADQIVDRSVIDNQYISWPIMPNGSQSVASQGHLGYAHGVAGMGAFLLDAAEYFNDENYLKIASKAVATLENKSIHRHSGAIDWPIGVGTLPEDESVVRWWCSGSGGIGSFLTRYATVTGDSTAASLAQGAALACAEDDMKLMPGHCHGISGNAHLFLDIANHSTVSFMTYANNSAHALLNRRIEHNGRLLFSNDSGNRVAVSYGQGITGPLGYLLRLNYQTPRPFYWNP